MVKAELSQDKIAIVAGNIIVFNFDSETREYLSSSIEYLAVGVGIPANSCIDVPGEGKTGFAICRTADLSSWEYITDHRGQTVYSTETMQQVEYSIASREASTINYIGPVKDGYTSIAPSSPYDKWNGKKWVTDADAKHAADVAAADQQKKSLLGAASAEISDWKAELELGMISDEDKASLVALLAYIKTLKAVDTSTAPEITWPTQPVR